MTANMLRKRNRLRALVQPLVLVSVTLVAGAVAAPAQSYFSPGNLVVSRSVYDNNPNNVRVGQILPPNCQITQAGCSWSRDQRRHLPLRLEQRLGRRQLRNHLGDLSGPVHSSRHAGQFADKFPTSGELQLVSPKTTWSPAFRRSPKYL